jgi:hypothetical protein
MATKTEHQIRLIAMLRDFTGKMPAAYGSQTEFFIVSLYSISEHLTELKAATLRETCDSFRAALDKGRVSDEALEEFKSVLDKLISEKDFRMISASMAGSKDLVRKRLSGLAPVSLLAEERKMAGRDIDADRHITEAYDRLSFGPLAAEVRAMPDDRTMDTTLLKARTSVREYCCMYHVPLSESDTLSPFSLSCVDAMVAASNRLLSNIIRIRAGGERDGA